MSKKRARDDESDVLRKIRKRSSLLTPGMRTRNVTILEPGGWRRGNLLCLTTTTYKKKKPQKGVFFRLNNAPNVKIGGTGWRGGTAESPAKEAEGGGRKVLIRGAVHISLACGQCTDEKGKTVLYQLS